MGVDVQAEKITLRKNTEAAKVRTLGVFLEEKYQPWALVELKSGKEVIRRIELHFSHLYSKPMREISDWLITKWRKARLEKGISPNTVNRDIACLKGALSKAVKWGVIETNPLAKLTALKVDTRAHQRYLSDDENKRLRVALDAREAKIKAGRDSGNAWREVRGYAKFAAFDANEFADHIKPIVLMLFNTGLRPKELFQLQWPNVDFKTKILTVAGDTAKSGKTRHVPLNVEALGVLIQWANQQADNSGLVFPSPVTGEAMDKVPRAVYPLFADAQLKNFRPYDLRHNFASQLVMNGATLQAVMELLGHEDISTTMIYAHLSLEFKAEAVELMNKF